MLKKTTIQNKWSYIFRHEFIQLIHLRENGFDQKKYNKRKSSYLPEEIEGYCKCSLKLVDSLCEMCDSACMNKLRTSID